MTELIETQMRRKYSKARQAFYYVLRQTPYLDAL